MRASHMSNDGGAGTISSHTQVWLVETGEPSTANTNHATEPDDQPRSLIADHIHVESLGARPTHDFGVFSALHWLIGSVWTP